MTSTSTSTSTPPVLPNTLAALRATLLNTSGAVPLAQRFRALFTLKSLGKSDSSDAALHIIAAGFEDPSALLKHELAYVLGQMGDLRAVPVLEEVLGDTGQDAMVRHEAAEALGALASTTSEPVLRRYLDDAERCVRETCEIALARIAWASAPSESQAQSESLSDSQFTSVDPAPPAPLTESSPAQIAALRTTLTTRTHPLFERYRAMFALRNIAGQRRPVTETAAVAALAAGFDDDSELFKHEIAFVFGQLATPHAAPALLRVLHDPHESAMVRHEAAEALGGIVDEPPRDAEPVDVLAVLKEWSMRTDAPSVVRESCVVAVDMWEYEHSNEFQYANGLEAVQDTSASAVAEQPERGAQVLVGA